MFGAAWVDDDTIVAGDVTDDGVRTVHVELSDGEWAVLGNSDGNVGEPADQMAFVPRKSQVLLQFLDDGSATVVGVDVETGLRAGLTMRRIHHRCRSAVPRVDRWRAHPLRHRFARTDPDLRRQPRVHPGVIGTADGSLILTRVVKAGPTCTTSLPDSTRAPIPIPSGEFQSVSIALDGSRMALGGGIENGYQIWDLDPTSWVEAACRLVGRNLNEQE